MPKLYPPAPAEKIYRTLREAGFETYFCGGCVRDALMGKAPKDWDITTAATPDEVEALFERTVPVGKAFGVMIVVEEEQNFEVATFRADIGSLDGRRPEGVEFCSAEEDVKRRDFTINALLYNPETDEIIDYVGGRDDIDNGIVRTVGAAEERFLEDHLRLLRAVRFAGRTGFKLEEKTRAAIGEMAGLVVTLSGERVGSELLRMLTEGYAYDAFVMLEETGLLAHLLPEVYRMKGVPQPKEFHPEGDVWQHTLIMLKMLDESMSSGACLIDQTNAGNYALSSEKREVLGWSVLLHDVGKPETLTFSDRIRFNEHDIKSAEIAETVLERLKRPRKIIDAVFGVVKRHMHFCNLREMKLSKLRKWLQDESFPLHLELHRLDCASSHGMLEAYYFGLEKWREEQAREPEPEPLLTGKDLLAMGYAPGPRIGEILRAVEDERLEGNIHNPQEAAAYVSLNYAP